MRERRGVGISLAKVSELGFSMAEPQIEPRMDRARESRSQSSADFQSAVSPISNRQSGRVLTLAGLAAGLRIWKSAIQQDGILRYERRISSCAAAAREGGCARGCKSHPWSWTVHHGTARCLSRREVARGVSSPGIEPMGLNEDEPQLMSLVTNYIRSRRVPGVRMKADVCAADNRQPAQSPAGSAWQARREGQPQIKRGGLRR
jgi:hypothetical protein